MQFLNLKHTHICTHHLGFNITSFCSPMSLSSCIEKFLEMFAYTHCFQFLISLGVFIPFQSNFILTTTKLFLLRSPVTSMSPMRDFLALFNLNSQLHWVYLTIYSFLTHLISKTSQPLGFPPTHLIVLFQTFFFFCAFYMLLILNIQFLSPLLYLPKFLGITPKCVYLTPSPLQ